MKLNFNFQIKGLDGKKFEGDQNSASKILATTLAQINTGNSIKLWDWAQKLWNKQIIEIDDTDGKVLEALIEKTENLPAMTKAQLLDYLEEQSKPKK